MQFEGNSEYKGWIDYETNLKHYCLRVGDTKNPEFFLKVYIPKTLIEEKKKNVRNTNIEQNIIDC